MKESEIPEIMALYQRAEKFKGVTPVDAQIFALLVRDVKAYSFEVICVAIEQARQTPPSVYFCPSLVLDKVKTIIESYPDYNAEHQWSLVEKYIIQQGEDNKVYHNKILFKNMITNLVIHKMGGQGFIYRSANERNDLDQLRRFTDLFKKTNLSFFTDDFLCRKLLVNFDPEFHSLTYIDGDKQYLITEQEADNAIRAAFSCNNQLLGITPPPEKPKMLNTYDQIKKRYEQDKLMFRSVTDNLKEKDKAEIKQGIKQMLGK